ncbi:hypothetical protein HPB47_021542 [Ixodes persulcatus]|uniref:Uncharacterized protein n=1 Tax=Ixodes persulcatus TaxID=34615 RepID=A0AC60QC79_IXOPE|nr:hypothetical protein HPB47_021542 [Ixodes persulcatus]
MNAERLFNLLCLYGNVVNIIFLKNKNGCAMVQMKDHLAKQSAVRHQNNAHFSNIKMQLGHISSPGSGYDDGYGALTNGHEDRYEGPQECDVASYRPRWYPLVLSRLRCHLRPESTATELEGREGGIVGFAAHHRAKELVLAARRAK